MRSLTALLFSSLLFFKIPVVAQSPMESSTGTRDLVHELVGNFTLRNASAVTLPSAVPVEQGSLASAEISHASLHEMSGSLAPANSADVVPNQAPPIEIGLMGNADVPDSSSVNPAADSDGDDDSSESTRVADPVKQPKKQQAKPPGPNEKIQWRPIILESLLSTGIMHTFNLWTEAGTRDALYGHWFENYIHSVSELRGWSDSDRFMAPYVGHSIQGSIFGYIFRQNDPKYRDVQWGDGRDYWMSILRSMAYGAVAHAQWKIGPLSEDSIGNVMLHASPGFITLVTTPMFGALTMIGEDVLDRYLIIGLENRTSNRLLIVLTRSFLNPGRSFANVMAFKKPWFRPTRIGVGGQDYLLRKQLVPDYRNGTGDKMFEFVRRTPIETPKEKDPNYTYPKEASIELAAYPNYEYFSGRNCIGGGGSGAARINPSLQIVGEVNGCLIMGMPVYTQSADSLFYGGGPRWTPRAGHKWSPYAEFLFGGRKVTWESDDPSLHKTLSEGWNDGNGTLPHYPKRSDWSVEAASNGVSVAAGGGLDVVVTRAFAWRFSAQYTHSWMGEVSTIHPQNGFRMTTEAVLRIGTW